MTDPAQLAARARQLDTSRAGIAAALGDPSATACVDAWVLALAAAVVGGKRRVAQVASDAETRALARALLSAAQALTAAWLADRSPPYAADEPDRAGARPPPGDAWQTPREIAEGVLLFLPLAAGGELTGEAAKPAALRPADVKGDRHGS